MVGYRCTYQSRLKTVKSGDRHMTAGRINRGVLCVYRSHSPRIRPSIGRDSPVFQTFLSYAVDIALSTGTYQICTIEMRTGMPQWRQTLVAVHC